MSDASFAYVSAGELARRIRARELSATELMQATLARIERINPGLNALVSLCPERALEAAKAADARLASGDPIGPLHGLPIAHKDLVSTAGIRTTFGSTLFRNFVPKTDDLIVERLRTAGALTVGKTNVPEFGAGSQTFNRVFGETLNPYDRTRTCGGSSGGAAVALAAGLLPIADGSDMGGSLRNPASFCNVVGFRSSPGRVPAVPSQLGWSGLSVLGPMARDVADTALLFSTIAGPDPRCPIALPEAGARFLAPLERDFRGVRIAWSRGLGDLPVDPRVVTALAPGRDAFATLGCRVDEGEPDFSGADDVFQTLRAWSFAARFDGVPDAQTAELKDTIQWNLEKGRKLSGADIGRAEVERTRLFARVYDFMQTHEFLALPTSQVPPFDVKERWVREIDGVAMETYIDWMKSCSRITLTGHPAISVPCGFTPEGLPVGLQIVGRHGDDFGVLQLAHAFEQATRTGQRRPPDLAA